MRLKIPYRHWIIYVRLLIRTLTASVPHIPATDLEVTCGFRPVLVPELGLVIVKPGRESMPVFHNTRVLVEPEPKSMRNLPSGVVPAVRQPLAEG